MELIVQNTSEAFFFGPLDIIYSEGFFSSLPFLGIFAFSLGWHSKKFQAHKEF
jgi:hypothetical protein